MNTRNTPPHELIIGANPTASIDTPEDFVPATQESLKQLQESRADAQKALQRCIKPLRLTKSFDLGDKVWLDARNLHIRKPSKSSAPGDMDHIRLRNKYHLSPTISNFPHRSGSMMYFHVDLLTPYHETEEYGANYLQPPSELIDGEEEYEVEEIIDERLIDERSSTSSSG